MGRERQEDLERIAEFLAGRGEPITIIVIGGTAKALFGLPRRTLDIDAEIACSDEAYAGLLSFLAAHKIPANIGENISQWGTIPLPQGYRERAVEILVKGSVSIKILDPADYVFSKLARGTETDEQDALDVCAAKEIGPDALRTRLGLVRLPKDPETRFFLDRTERFFKRLEQTAP
ncbi:MAG: hypothetical protein HYR98_01525 [Nitrospirae bacterium]|nr:hypothetical protein [Nitrospirota bacterium]